MSKIRVLVVRSDQEPVVEEIDDDLPSIRRVLDCQWVQAVGIGGGYQVWLDEEGIYNHKPQNGCGFLGTYLFARSDELGEMVGLSEEQVQECLNYWNKYRYVSHPMESHWEVTSFDSMDEMLEYTRQYHDTQEKVFRESQP